MKWIKCSDRLPDHIICVSGSREKRTKDILFYDGDIWLGFHVINRKFSMRSPLIGEGRIWRTIDIVGCHKVFNEKNVTHWMEIEAPND